MNQGDANFVTFITVKAVNNNYCLFLSAINVFEHILGHDICLWEPVMINVLDIRKNTIFTQGTGDSRGRGGWVEGVKD